MSRLQVGGLALYIPNGLQCELIEYTGSGYLSSSNGNGDKYEHVWKIRFRQHVVTEDTGNLRMEGYCPHYELIPLGDQKTQDELRKEEMV